MNAETRSGPRVPRGRERHPQHNMDECVRIARDCSMRCLWPGCDEYLRMVGGGRTIGDAPLCTPHLYAAWRVAEDLAERNGEYVRAAAPRPTRRTDQPVAKTGWIYYLRIGDHIKIGYASSLENRLRQYPPNAEYLLAHRGTKVDEKVAHDLLTVYRAAGKEWYSDCDEVADYIEQMRDRHGETKDPRPVRRETNGNAVGMRRRNRPVGKYVR